MNQLQFVLLSHTRSGIGVGRAGRDFADDISVSIFYIIMLYMLGVGCKICSVNYLSSGSLAVENCEAKINFSSFTLDS